MAEFVASLVDEGDGIRHLGQVAQITTEELKVIRRKFASVRGWELASHRLSDVESMEHFDERPFTTLVGGALMLLVAGSVVVLLVVNWSVLAPETRVPVLSIGTILLAGVRWLFSARRHRLVFRLRDGAELSWASRPGEHALRTPASQNVLELARSRGWMSAVPRAGWGRAP